MSKQEPAVRLSAPSFDEPGLSKCDLPAIMGCMEILRAHLLAPCPPWGFVEHVDGVLVIGEHGRIAEVGDARDLLPRMSGAPVRDLRPMWVLPGLVDLHTHAPQYPVVAMDGLELLAWLQHHVYPAEARFADPDRARVIAKAFFLDLLSRGTTTVVVLSSIHEEATRVLFEEACHAGIRAVIGKVMMDAHVPDAMREDVDESLAASERLCAEWHGRDHGRLMYAFTPRFAPACSIGLMRGIADLAEKHGAFIQTHLSENRGEVSWVRRLFPEAQDYTDVYRRAGLLGPRTLLAHGIHLNAAERATIKAAGATIVHCPRSNAFLQSGIMPARRWLDEGLKVGLGTDVAAGPTLSMWAEAASACMVSKLQGAERPEESPIQVTEAFHLATLGGARALGLTSQIGSLKVGEDADFVVVDPRVVHPVGDPILNEDAQAVLSRLLYCERPEMVRATYVRGRCCFQRHG